MQLLAAGMPRLCTDTGAKVGVNLMSTSLGTCFVELFCVLLCTAIAIGSHWAQFS